VKGAGVCAATRKNKRACLHYTKECKTNVRSYMITLSIWRGARATSFGSTPWGRVAHPRVKKGGRASIDFLLGGGVLASSVQKHRRQAWPETKIKLPPPSNLRAPGETFASQGGPPFRRAEGETPGLRNWVLAFESWLFWFRFELGPFLSTRALCFWSFWGISNGELIEIVDLVNQTDIFHCWMRNILFTQ